MNGDAPVHPTLFLAGRSTAEVEAFIARLMEEWEKGRKPEANKGEEAPQRRVFGIAKGMATMTEDFDEPLDDMKDYME